MERLQTQCKALDGLTDGGLATGTITQVFGEKALGKSILSLQSAFATVLSGRSAVIIDTEQSYGSYLLPYWKERIPRRFGREVSVVEASLTREPKSSKKKPVTRNQLTSALATTLNQSGLAYLESQLEAAVDALSPELRLEFEAPKDPSVILLQIPEIMDLLGLHGVDAALGVSEGGRVETRLRAAPVYNSVLREIISKTGAKLLVYDSISAPLKASFPSTQDLPARSSSLAMILMHAQRLCIEFDLAVLATSHVSINPIHAWERHPFGGVILGHEAKFCFELTRAGAKRNEEAEAINPEEAGKNVRCIWVQRHPAMDDYAKFGYFAIEEDGIH